MNAASEAVRMEGKCGENLTDFTRIDYLQEGTPKQRSAYAAISELGIISALQPYNPILAGTIPLGIDVPDSDLDIVCEVHDHDGFASRLAERFGALQGFQLRSGSPDGMMRTVCRFVYAEWAFELFGQSIPTARQNAFRHMMIEARILKLLNGEQRERLMKFRRDGMKTEPAFGKLLQLQGDPYILLLDMESWEDRRLYALVRSAI